MSELILHKITDVIHDKFYTIILNCYIISLFVTNQFI
jgi:hypothetical protein